MNNILLIIIAVLLGVRIFLQVRQGKRAFESHYCAPSEVENIVRVAKDSDTENDINYHLWWASNNGYELVSTERASDACYLFFTRKKIKNFYEE